MKQQQVNALLVVLVVVVLAVGTATASTMAYAQSESETETEQEIKQKNVCSGWAICTNEPKCRRFRFGHNNRSNCWIPLIIDAPSTQLTPPLTSHIFY